MQAEMERIWNVADDYEMSIIEGLRRRAGLTWECPDCWTNEEDDQVCGQCGEPKPGTEKESAN